MPSLSILIVEDQEDSARAMARLLQSEGHAVTTAFDFAGALAVAARIGSIDVLVCDIALPDGDGCSLLRVLQERLNGPPRRCIALTGYTESHWIEECRRAGFQRCLSKPVVFDELLAALGTSVRTPPAGTALGGVPSPGTLTDQDAAAR